MLGQNDLTGCRFVLVDMPHRELARLFPMDDQPKDLQDPGGTRRRAFGYTLNLGLDAQVLPEALAHTAYLVTGPGTGADVLCLERQPELTPGRASLSATCTVPAEDATEIDSGALRDAILDRLRWLLPFLDNHLRVIHSPQDGFGAIDLKGDARGESFAVPPAEQVPRWEIPLPGEDPVLGIGDAGHRTSVRGVLQCGRQVMRGLDLEGELLAGWAAVKLCGLRDRESGMMARPISGQF
jgi:hypothetical protein